MRYLAMAAAMLTFSVGGVTAQDRDTSTPDRKAEEAPVVEDSEEKQEGIQFLKDLDEAKKLAAADGKKLLIYFSIPN